MGAVQRRHTLALGNGKDEIEFKEATLEMLTGEAWLMRPRARPDVESVESGERVDLLKRVDPRRHAMKGDWRLHDGVLRIENARYRDRAYLPVVPRGDYVLRAEVTRTAVRGTKTVAFILPVGERRVLVALDHGNHRVSGLMLVDGLDFRTPKDGVSNPTCVRPGRLENHRRYRVEAHVSTCGEDATIRVTLDGEDYIQWSGPRSTLSISPDWDLPIPGVPGIGVGAATLEVHKLELEMLSGRAYLPRGL